MSNHLGNVLTVINDIKVPQTANNIDVDGYLATILSTADYSQFGVQLDGRTESGESYRYGFQGEEKDDELKGDGNSVITPTECTTRGWGGFLRWIRWRLNILFIRHIHLVGIEFLMLLSWKVWSPRPFMSLIKMNVEINYMKQILSKLDQTNFSTCSHASQNLTCIIQW
jgi:hypothetical protein